VKSASSEQPSPSPESVYPEKPDEVEQPEGTAHLGHGRHSQRAAAAVEPGSDESSLDSEAHPEHSSHPSYATEESSSVPYTPATAEPGATAPTHTGKEAAEEEKRH
jgi:hypothetical protein